MPSIERATVALVALLVGSISHVASAQNGAIPAGLITELHRWIDATTPLSRADTPAVIVFADEEDVTGPGEMASMIGKSPRGFYDLASGTITLIRPWSAESPQDVAVLLHELVHHRQGSKHYYCEAAKEHIAYHVQKDWLAERALPLDVNWIAVVLASSCAVRDFHP